MEHGTTTNSNTRCSKFKGVSQKKKISKKKIKKNLRQRSTLFSSTRSLARCSLLERKFWAVEMPVNSVSFLCMENFSTVFMFPEEIIEDRVEDEEATEEAATEEEAEAAAAVAGRRRRCWLRTTL